MLNAVEGGDALQRLGGAQQAGGAPSRWRGGPGGRKGRGGGQRLGLLDGQRVPGVGQAQLFGTERAMRIWVDPAKLQGFNLSPADVAAVRAGLADGDAVLVKASRSAGLERVVALLLAG